MKTNANMLKIMALATLVLAGCSQQQVLASLEASVAATEALVATLQANGQMSPITAGEIESAIVDLPAAFRETAAELSSSDTAAAMAAKITGYYASTIVALKALPPEAQIYASAIAASIQAFLSGLPPAEATRSLARGVAPTKFDSTRLNAIGIRAAVLGVQVAELKANATETSKAAGR